MKKWSYFLRIMVAVVCSALRKDSVVFSTIMSIVTTRLNLNLSIYV
jgi:hypothetical protein